MLNLACILFIISVIIPYKVIDNEIEPYYSEYMNIVQAYCKPDQYFNPWQMSIQFAELENNIIAQCQSNNISKYNIIYNTNYWKKQNHIQKKATIFHELQHCVFNEDHSENPDDFMYAYETVISDSVLNEQLIEHLKNQCQ